MTTFNTTETPDFWREVYDACRFDEIPEAPCYETFLEDPWRYLHELGQGEAPLSIASGHRPLLPAQAAIARRLRAEDVAADNRAKLNRAARLARAVADTTPAAALH